MNSTQISDLSGQPAIAKIRDMDRFRRRMDGESVRAVIRAGLAVGAQPLR